MDAKESTLRIVDYKTGGSPKIPANIEQLFTPSETRPNYIFQTFLYAAIMSRQQSLNGSSCSALHPSGSIGKLFARY